MIRIKLLSIIFFLFMGSSVAHSQVYFNQYRPSGLDWQVLKTDHFKIIFPAGDDSLAYRAGQILEQQYPIIQDLIGGNLKNFPIVLNNYNDLSNGFVSPFNFRSEIETPPIKGKALNPRTGDWYETVLSHELVHALHFSKTGGVLADFIGYFWKDAARIVHAWAPVGVHEGIAVYHESEGINHYGDGGRLNYPFFNNRFLSNFDSNSRWINGQILLTSDFTVPFNRHYVAGAPFTHWLHEEYGEDITQKTIEQHYRTFFLGYGYALRRTTGKWPKQLIRDFHAHYDSTKAKAPLRNTDDISNIVDLPFDGEQVSRPFWINENKVAFLGTYYDGVNGFYSYGLEEDKVSLEEEAFPVRDYNYDKRGSSIVYSAFEGDQIYDNTFTSQIIEKDFETGKRRKLKNSDRSFSPTYIDDGYIALRTYDADNELIVYNEAQEITKVIRIPDLRFVEVKSNPRTKELAILGLKNGVQGLWFVKQSEIENRLFEAPDIAFKNASIFDLSWHPSENRILLTIDNGGVMNIYDFDVDEQKLSQLTDSQYNAMEASWSPNAGKLAYAVQFGDEKRLAIIDAADIEKKDVDESIWNTNTDVKARLDSPLLGSEIDTTNWRRFSYSSTIDWIKPRGILPVGSQVAGTNSGNRFGAAVFGADALSRHSYYYEMTFFDDRPWWEFQYRNTTFYPGFRITASSTPSITRFTVRDPSDDTRGLRYENTVQNREFKLSIPFQYRFRANTRLTSLLFEPGLSIEQIRFFNQQGLLNSDWAEVNNFNIFTQLNVNVLQLRRDIQPRSGFILFGQTELGLNKTTQPQRLRDLDGRLFTVQRVYDQASALILGTFVYVSPLAQYNQSLRLNLSMLTQTESLVFNTESLVPLGFSDDVFDRFDNNTMRFSTRYIIPLLYPDQGGITLPLYFSSIYLSAFSHTLGNFSGGQYFTNPRTQLGLGLRFRMKLSNFVFDIGAGVTYEPSRNEFNWIVGEF